MAKHSCPDCGVLHSTDKPHSHGPTQQNKHGVQVAHPLGWGDGTPGWSHLFKGAPGHFIGRNGTFGMNGVQIAQDKLTGMVTLTPLTSKGKPGKCMLQIPGADLAAVVAIMQSGLLNVPQPHIIPGLNTPVVPTPVEAAMAKAAKVAKAKLPKKNKAVASEMVKAVHAAAKPGAVKASSIPADETPADLKPGIVVGVPFDDTLPAGDCTCRKAGKWQGCPQHDPNVSKGKQLGGGGWTVTPLV